MVIGRIALKKARKRWKYDKDTKETLKRGKAKVIKGGKQGKGGNKTRIKVTGKGKVKRVYRHPEKPIEPHPDAPEDWKARVRQYNKGLLAEVQEGADKAVKDKQRLRGEIGPPPPKGKNNPKLNLQIRTKLKELEAADKRKKKKTTKPKNGKKK